LVSYDWEHLLLEAKKVVESSITDVQKKHRQVIFKRLTTLLRKAKREGWPQDKVFEHVVQDFELFCVCFVRLDDLKPMFPAVWQSEVFEIIEDNIENLFILCRKVGKSALGTAYSIWRAVSRGGRRIVLFAPSQKQLFMMEDIVKCIKRSQFFQEYFVKESDGGRLSVEHLIFAYSFSEIVSSNLALKQKASTKRGQKGSDIVVDEIGLVEKEIMQTVINDMMADAYTEKKMSKWGTPDLRANPDLENEWKEACADPEIGTFHMDIWDGVEQGCISKWYVKKRFKDLRIMCPWGRKKGICGKRWGKGVFDAPKGTKWHNWKCKDECMLNEVFVVENMGEFPKFAGRFFPKPNLETSMYDDMDVTAPNPQEGHSYVMGIDFGAGINPTQITVWDKVGDNLVLDYWVEVLPVEADQRQGHRTYDPIIHRVQQTYSLYGIGFKNQIKRIFPDATTIGQQVTNDLTKDRHAIPLEKIWSNQMGEGQKKWIGVWLSGQFKSDMMGYYQRFIKDGRIKVPTQEPFGSKWMQEHNTIIVERSADDNYLKFKEPKGGSIDLVDSCALAALELSPLVEGEGVYLGYVQWKPKPKLEKPSNRKPPGILIEGL
jgi:hypothetical protein